MIRLFEINNGVVIPTEHCHRINWLKSIIDEYPKKHLNIFTYIFYMTCPSEENPFFNAKEYEKEDMIKDSMDINFSPEDELVIEALEKCTKMFETPTLRAYNGLKIAIDNIADFMAGTKITDGKEGNITQIKGVAKDFDHIRQSFKGVGKDLKEEQEQHVRGSQNIAYDQLNG
jgi:hypothetical protein